jgi:hypothetical protein
LPLPSNEAVEVSAVDHPAVVRAGLRVVAIELADRLCQVPHERIFDLGHTSTWSGAVQTWPELRCARRRWGRGHFVRRVLATQLKHARRQVPGRRLVNDLADLGAASDNLNEDLRAM